jgi:hypothetical protein
MSMHLCGPALTTTGKKKGKVKFASADEKRRAEQAETDWKDLQKRWGVEAEDKKRKRAMAAAPLSTNNLRIPEGRNTTKNIKSLSTGLNVAPLKPVNVYTGTKMLGIGQLHKSNAVPVFSDQDAIDIARMRR